MKPVRGYFRYCQIQKKVVPVEEVMVEVPANVAHGYIPDEMEAAKHPVDGKYYTSKAKFRAVTRSAGYEEVGTAYENGYEPEKELKTRESALQRQVVEQFRERFKYGPTRK